MTVTIANECAHTHINECAYAGCFGYRNSFTLRKTLWSKYYCNHFPDNEMEFKQSKEIAEGYEKSTAELIQHRSFCLHGPCASFYHIACHIQEY